MTHNVFFVLFLLNLFAFFSRAETEALWIRRPLNNSVPAIFVFGDSTSDPGNNNFVKTPFRADFPPYGKDFKDQVPTGRFSNGLLAADYIARYVGVKEYVPPYLDPTLSIDNLMTGVSFASAGSGFDPLTPEISNVIPLQKQIEYFKEYQSRLAAVIGEKRTKEIVRNALYIVSAGTNDFVVNYFTIPIRRKSYSLQGYMDFLLKTQMQFMQSLWDQGARRIAVASLAPMGCLPIVMTLFSHSENTLYHSQCLEYYNSVSITYNEMLRNKLNVMQSKYAPLGARIAILDVYRAFTQILQAHNGFEETKFGCCGTGILEVGFLCNFKSPVCPDASKYVFWDSIHPSQKTYYLISVYAQPILNYIIKN